MMWRLLLVAVAAFFAWAAWYAIEGEEGESIFSIQFLSSAAISVGALVAATS